MFLQLGFAHVGRSAGTFAISRSPRDVSSFARRSSLSGGDFPAELWDHVRTTNPIESVFATVRHRTVRTKGALSQETVKLTVFKLVIAASKTWRRLQGENQLLQVIRSVICRDGIEVTEATANNAA